LLFLCCSINVFVRSCYMFVVKHGWACRDTSVGICVCLQGWCIRTIGGCDSDVCDVVCSPCVVICISFVWGCVRFFKHVLDIPLYLCLCMWVSLRSLDTDHCGLCFLSFVGSLVRHMRVCVPLCV
jgi:hypothetical protein